MAKGLSHGRPAGKCQDPGFEPRCPESLSHLPPYAVILSRCPPPNPASKSARPPGSNGWRQE